MRTAPGTASAMAAVVFAALVIMSSGAKLLYAQPALSDLWPNGDGTKWTYDFAGWDTGSTWDGEATLTLAGTTNTSGGTAQNLVGWHDGPVAKPGLRLDSLHRNLWLARPDLREAIEAKARNHPNRVAAAPTWHPLLLHPGFFMKLSNQIEMWQESLDHSTWIYLTRSLWVGAEFTYQLVPDLADDVFLHGTVESNSATVTTAAGTFDNAVKVAYEIDYGESVGTDETGQPWGTLVSKTVGHVHYVPDVGPVDTLEEFIPFASVDCGLLPCSQEILDQVGQVFLHMTLNLNAGPVGVEEKRWGAVKQLYQ